MKKYRVRLKNNSWLPFDEETGEIKLPEHFGVDLMYNNDLSKEQILTQRIIIKQEQEINRLNNIIDKARRILGQYAHYSTPTEEQNAKNEAIVDEAYMQLHNNLKELKGDNK